MSGLRADLHLPSDVGTRARGCDRWRSSLRAGDRTALWCGDGLWSVRGRSAWSPG